MGYKKPSFIEGIAEKLGIIPNLHKDGHQEFDQDMRHFTGGDDAGKQVFLSFIRMASQQEP